MDKSVPVLYVLYTYARSIISANRITMKVLKLEFLVLISLNIGVLIYTKSPIELILTSSISFLIPISYYIYKTPKDDWNKSHKILKQSFTKTILLKATTIAPFSIYTFLFPIPPSFWFSFSLIGLYVILLFIRSDRYRGERKFCPQNDYENENWISASVSLEQAINFLEEEKIFRAYYWGRKSNNQYFQIYENINEEELSKKSAAKSYAEASDKITEQIRSPIEKQIHISEEIKYTLETASEYLSKRVCDHCGEVYHVSECTYFYMEDGENTIYCDQCINRGEHKTRDYSDTQQNTRENTNYNKNNNYKNNEYNRNDNTGEKREEKNETELIEESLSVLGLEKPLTEDEIKEKYRDLIKEHHPDQGGSAEKFKEIQNSKEFLLEHIDKK